MNAESMSQSNGAWTDERIEELKSLCQRADLSCSDIGRMMNVSANAVVGKMHRLGLDKARKVGLRLAKKRKSIASFRSDLPALAPEPFKASEGLRGASSCGILDLKANSCRWPHGDPRHSDFVFCGDRALNGLPYCAKHTRLAHQ